jgi:hypothetical protein
MSAIRSRAGSRQIIDFEGLSVGGCVGTDIDYFIEWRDSLYVIGEIGSVHKKENGAQNMALERLAAALRVAGKSVLLFWASHTAGIGQDVIAAHCKVVRAEYNGHEVKNAEGSSLSHMLAEFNKRVVSKRSAC